MGGHGDPAHGLLPPVAQADAARACYQLDQTQTTSMWLLGPEVMFRLRLSHRVQRKADMQGRATASRPNPALWTLDQGGTIIRVQTRNTGPEIKDEPQTFPTLCKRRCRD